MSSYSSGTAQAVLDYAEDNARLIFSCGWHITMDGKDRFSNMLKTQIKLGTWVGKLFRAVDLDDQVEACNRK